MDQTEVSMRPHVTVYCEVTADGKTAQQRGASSIAMMSYESDEVRVYRHELRAQSDALMVGSNTIRTDNPRLTVRHAPGTSPLRVVPASTGDLPLDSAILLDGNPTLVAVSLAALPERIAALQLAGVEVVILGETRVDLPSLMRHLLDRGVRSLMVEGGESLLAELFRLRLVDRLVVQHLPVIFGGKNAPAMVGGSGICEVKDAIRLRLLETRNLGGHAIIIYVVEPE
jgi:2,5-diamino-6-(ribosylamino)-4(3H)-pyrimidinone 5'-phosphate reductase